MGQVPTQNTLGALLQATADPVQRDTWRRALGEQFGCPIIACESAESVLAQDLGRVWALVAALPLGEWSGADLLSRVLQQRPDLPVVFVAETEQLPAALRTLELGAYDYLLTAGDYALALPALVQRSLDRWRNRQETQQLQDQLAETLQQVRVKNRQLQQAVTKLKSAAGTDPLTGLANRRAFGQALERSFAEAHRYGHDLACLMIDLDGFKQLNDTMGHPVGDRVLARVGRVLEACCRRSDAAGRFGGDEFIVLLPRTEAVTAAQVAERIRQQFQQASAAEAEELGTNPGLSMSLGLATLHRSGAATAEQLITSADQALYHAKTAGRNQLRIHDRRRERSMSAETCFGLPAIREDA
jgi:diguanylate cyclase (GGDEF)-like protein